MHHCTRTLHIKAWGAGSTFLQAAQEIGAVQWTPEAKEALQSLKSYLALPPILVAPVDKEPLLQYIGATNQVVSGILVVERDAPTDKSKGKRFGNTLPGQPSKKRTLGNDGSKDPRPGELACAAKEAAEEALLMAFLREEEFLGSAESSQG